MTKEDKMKITAIMEQNKVMVGYLFGSAARGTMGPHSDIDLAVLFDRSMNEEVQNDLKEKVRDMISDTFNREKVDVLNLVTVTDPLIKYIAVFSGELIFKRSDQEQYMLERYILREYENTRELRRIARLIMREQLKDGSFGLSLTNI